jgi:hypothetical protein
VFRDMGAAGHMEHDLTAIFTAAVDGAPTRKTG